MRSKSSALLKDVKKLYAEESKKKNTLTAKVQKKKVKKISPERMEQLILEHREHGKRLAWSFLTTWRIRLRNDEVVSVVGAALCEAATRFDESRGVSFKTFFFYHLRGLLLKEIARMINDHKSIVLAPNNEFCAYGGDIINIDKVNNHSIEFDDPERILEKRESVRACWDACEKLDTLEQEVIVRHYIYDEPLIEIADQLDYCRCHISKLKSKGIAKLNRLLSKNKLFEDEAKESKPKLVQKITREKSVRKANNYKGGRGRRKELESSDKVEKIRAISR